MVTAHWREHIRTSAFGTIHAATFSFSRPIGTDMPRPLSYQLASLDPGLITLPPWNASPAGADDPPLPFPTVDRSAKGDRQPVSHPPQREPETAKVSEETPVAASPPAEPVAVPPADAVESAAVPAEAVATKSEQLPAASAGREPAAATEGEVKAEATEGTENPPEDIPDPVDVAVADAPDFLPPQPEPMVEMARLYFGNEPFGDGPGVIEKWAPGEDRPSSRRRRRPIPTSSCRRSIQTRRRRKPRVAKASRRKAKSPARAGARCRRPSG